jgi:Domain of unknown function (DUF4124)
MKNKSNLTPFTIMLFAAFISSQAYAEVFKCKDAKNKITYQSSPCLTSTVGKVRKDADIPEADRLRAQERIDGVFERERQRDAAAERERLARQESARKFELEREAKANEKRKIELLERQAIAAEEATKQAKAARIAAERAQQAAGNQRLRCRPDYAGGLICD